jgi:hypothetical protein
MARVSYVGATAAAATVAKEDIDALYEAVTQKVTNSLLEGSCRTGQNVVSACHHT